MQNCHSCNFTCEDFKDLALHIIKNKSTHRKGLKWASAYLFKVNFLNQKVDKPEGRITLTEEQKEAKENSQRELSGNLASVKICCPLCNTYSRDRIPIEYTESSFAWKSKSGEFLINCLDCRK
jgi:hypothetical protein